MVRAYQDAFGTWLRSVEAHLASAEGKAARPDELAEVLERSFQTQLDDVSLEQLGRKLIGPTSSPVMTDAVKELDNRRRVCKRSRQGWAHGR